MVLCNASTVWNGKVQLIATGTVYSVGLSPLPLFPLMRCQYDLGFVSCRGAIMHDMICNTNLAGASPSKLPALY
jgi:hypothetical protein